MYQVSVPILNDNATRNDREKALLQLKQLDAKRVFMATGRYHEDPQKRAASIQALRENTAFFKAHGYEVGAWVWTFWLTGNTHFRVMRSIEGNDIKDFMCPSDPNVVTFITDYLKEFAKCGVDLIQFDDDFRYGCLDLTPCCLCDGHLAEIYRILGEEISREELAQHILNGGKNKYRDAYLQANGNVFRNFVQAVRAAVDEVDPNIRIGACTCMTAWDIDGIDPYEKATILAGKNKPFFRLIGAPYWAVDKNWGNCMQDVVELSRMECAWSRQGDVEIMAEGDVYPRPRTRTPASYLEGLDTAMRAAGCADGILKYGIDYHSNADYETGYARFHQRNLPVYAQIDEFFGDKTSCGVRIYESAQKFADMQLPTKVNKTVDLNFTLFSKAARTMAFNTIPTVYEGSGVCGIAFDENARKLPAEALETGLIVDIAAAEILTEQGIDVGLVSIGEQITDGKEEHFLDNGNHIGLFGCQVYDIKIKDRAEVLSDMQSGNGVVPISYRYENGNGQRFLVLNINSRCDADNLFKHYERSRQYAQQIPWLSGKKLPAYSYGHPALYIQCKEKNGKLAVGLWNFFADIAMEPVVELNQSYKNIRFINCNGRLEGAKVYLEDIPAFGFVGFEVS